MILLPALLSTFAFAAEPGTANFTSKGFTISDAPGENLINLGLSFQPRFLATLDGDPDATDADAVSDAGFRIRRMLVTANGTIAKKIDFRLRLNTSSAFTFTDADGKSQQASRATLDDSQVVFRIAEPFQISIGQYKVPFTASQMMADTTLLFPDRALPVDGVKYGDVKLSALSYSRDVGVHFQGYAAKRTFEYQIGVFNGDGANVWPPADDGPLVTARVQAAPLGEFKYDEVDLDRGKPRLAVGAGVGWNNHPAFDDEGAADGSATDLRFDGELRFQAAGLSVNGEVLYNIGTPADGSDPTNTLGFYAQAGYMLPAGVAPGVRFARLDPDLDGEDDGLSHVEGVVNWYVPDVTKKGANLGHKAQVQAGWTTALLDGLDHPLYHQVQLAVALTL